MPTAYLPCTRVRWLCAVMALLAVITLSMLASHAEATDRNLGKPGLFADVTDRSPADFPLPPMFRKGGVLRSRLVYVDIAQMDAPEAASSRTLLLNAFPDEGVLVASGQISQRESGSAVFWGQVQGQPHSSVTLVATGSMLVGTVRAGTRVLHVTPVRDGVHAIVDIAPAAYNATDDVLPDPTVPPTPSSLHVVSTPADDGSLIDVMVVYTARAREGSGGEEAMKAQIELAVEEMNQSLANSEVTPRVRLVHTAEVVYDDIGWLQRDGYIELLGLEPALTRLQEKRDGYLDEVHVLRDLHRADLVSLIVAYEYPPPSGCGLGYVMTEDHASVYYEFIGFSVVDLGCFPEGLTFAHELGHNMGCGHQRGASGHRAFEYSYGYVEPSGAFHTVMANDCFSPGISYWSNPDVSYDGMPTGVHYLEPDAADNRRTLNETAPIVANFRTSNCTMSTAKVLVGDWLLMGDEEGQLHSPRGIALGSDGSIYVLDSGNGRVQQFDASGAFQSVRCNVSNPEGLCYPYGLAVRPDGSILVSQTYAGRIGLCSADSTTATPWSVLPSDDAELFEPGGIALAPDGSVYAVDMLLDRVVRFTSNGRLIQSWGSHGSGPGQFLAPRDVAVAPNGTVYVSDLYNYRVQYFSPTGVYLGEWGSEGTGGGEFGWPQGLAVARDGTVWVTDNLLQRVQRFSASGEFLESHGGCRGRAEGQFDWPMDVEAGPDGVVYIVEQGNHRVQTLQSTLGPDDGGPVPWKAVWLPLTLR